MATVLMSGRPPPLKLYRQAASASVAMLAPTAPQRGREHDRRVHPNHREFKASRGLREIDAGLGRLRADGELRAAACHDLALAAPLRLERPRWAIGGDIVERVRILNEAPDRAWRRLRARHAGGGVRRPYHAERRPQHAHGGH